MTQKERKMTQKERKMTQVAQMPASDAVEQAEAQGFDISAIARGKAQLRDTIAADCRKIAEYKADASEVNSIAEGLADKPLSTSLAALKSGLLSDDELNAILCDAFGSKDNKGKTPLGYGLSMRKRYRTLDTARLIVEGKTPAKMPTWADWNDKETLAYWLDAIESGETSPSYAYAQITKRPENSKPILALDPKALTKLAEQLLNPDNQAAIAKSPALQEAYKAIAANLPA